MNNIKHQQSDRPIGSFRLGTLVALLLLSVSSAMAQDQDPLVDQSPIDLIRLNKVSGGKLLEVVSLRLEDRNQFKQPASGSFTVELASQRGVEYTLHWQDVQLVQLYEYRLLVQARQHTRKDEFGEAFRYYNRLLHEYPNVRGLQKALAKYLIQNAAYVFKQGKPDHALSILMQLYERDPTNPLLSGAVNSVGGKIVKKFWEEKNYTTARIVLDQLKREFPKLKLTQVASWEKRFTSEAQKLFSKAQTEFKKKNYITARYHAISANAIIPNFSEAVTLLNKINAVNPQITVGVYEACPTGRPLAKIDAWAAIRTNRLNGEMLTFLSDYSSEGGVYESPWGELLLDDSSLDNTGLILSFTFPQSAIKTGRSYLLGKYLINRTDPQSEMYLPQLDHLIQKVGIEPDRVDLYLKQAHIRPEAILQILLTDEDMVKNNSTLLFESRYQVSKNSKFPRTTRFDLKSNQQADASRGAFKAIVETVYPNEEAAISALIRGEIDILDRLPLWKVKQLQQIEFLQVAEYRVPTVHALVPHPDTKIMKRREFRRALIYGINRKQIVENILCGGTLQKGYSVISGPFSVGVNTSDPLRYAVNPAIKPRPYEPRLALTLLTVAATPAKKKSDKEPPVPGEIPPLILAHTSDPVAKVCCASIKIQLQRLGLDIILKEMTTEEMDKPAAKYDLRYVELTVAEPIVDAKRILGPEGITRKCSSHLGVALRKIDEAKTWPDMQLALHNVHKIANSDLTIIPLWQTLNYFAYNKSIKGMDRNPITLYQNLDNWKITPSAKGRN